MQTISVKNCTHLRECFEFNGMHGLCGGARRCDVGHVGSKLGALGSNVVAKE